MGIATRSKRPVLNRKMGQGKVAVRRTVACVPQLDPANRFISPTGDVNYLRRGFSKKREDLPVDKNVMLKSRLFAVKMEVCRSILCCIELRLSCVKERGCCHVLRKSPL